MKKVCLFVCLFMASTGCGPDSESGPEATDFSPDLFDFGINVVVGEEIESALVGSIVVALLPVSDFEPTVGPDATLTISDESEAVFEWACTAALDLNEAPKVILDCPSLSNLDAEVLCDKLVTARAKLTLNGDAYTSEVGAVTITCMENERRLDLLERPTGNNPTNKYCSESDGSFEERYGYKDGRLHVIQTVEDGDLTGVKAFDYDGNGLLISVTNVFADGFVSDILTYEYQSGAVSSRTLTKSSGESESCTYMHTDDSFTATCPNSTRTTTWDRNAKTISRESGGKDFVFSYSGELTSLTEFSTQHPADTANVIKPIDDSSTDGSVTVAYTYASDLIVSAEFRLNGMVQGTQTYSYDCN